MDQPLVSVIVPVYNVEPYLRPCVDSILNQTYANLEIILVDDGSPDNCPAICDEYAEKDSRVKVIHKKNGGQSESRNMALDICCGMYITFVDSDDFIAPDMVETMVTACLQTGSDLSFCGYSFEQDEWRRSISPQSLPDGKILGLSELQNAYLAGDIHTPVWAKVYHRTVWEGLRFPAGLIYEDAYILPELLDRCHQVVFCGIEGYTQRIREGSTTTSAFSPRNLDRIHVAEYNMHYYQTHHADLYPQTILWKSIIILNCLADVLYSFSYRRYRALYHDLEKQLSQAYAAAQQECPEAKHDGIEFALRYPVLFRQKCFGIAVIRRLKNALKRVISCGVFARCALS